MTQPSVDHEQLRLQLGLYVLGALCDSEAEVVEQHLAGCPQCQVEGAELSEVLAMLSMLSIDEVRSVAEEVASDRSR